MSARAKQKTVVSTKPVDMEMVYASLITYPDDDSAIRFMSENGYEVSPAKMAVFRRGTNMPTSPYYEPYLKRREQLAPRLEAKLAEDLLSEAGRATEAVAFCVERTHEMLQKDEIRDPARAARDLSQIRTQAIDKRLALQGRPTSVTVNLDPETILKRLEAKGLIHDAEGTAIEEAESTAIEESTTPPCQ